MSRAGGTVEPGDPTDGRATQAVVLADDLPGVARQLLAGGGRRLVGLSGPPGSGKSTIAATLCARLAPDAVVVPADGFHLADGLLRELGLDDRKGAPETFDVEGFLSLLARIRAGESPVVYAPRFERSLEAAVVGAIAVHRSTPLVIVEGNYLLVDHGPWSAARRYLDASWHVEVGDELRRRRLVRRHQEHGRSAEEARRWTFGNDEANAVLIRRSRSAADLLVRGG